MIILSCSERTAPRAAALLASPPRGAGAVEVRLDALASPDPRRLAPARWPRPRIPRIATCRPAREGGGFRGGEREREAILGAALACGFHFVDAEAGTPLARRLLQAFPGRIILSRHDRRRTPPARELLAIHRGLAGQAGVAAIKIVTTAREARDILEIRRLLARAAGEGRPPLIALAMGEWGRASRILSPSWGAWGTFACTGRERQTGPGQLTLEEARDLYRVDDIGPSTRLAAIIGNPVAHSLSPVIHNAAYRHLGMDWRYLPLAVRDIESLPGLFRELPLAGASVTAPHKEAAARLASRRDELAAQLGAANTLALRNGRLHAFNTDVAGIREPVLRRIRQAGGMTALILGAGGAARAAAVALAREGARVTVASRRPGRGRAVARLAGGRWVPLTAGRLPDHDILINATPVGMDGRGAPPGASHLRSRLVGDMVYRPGSTPLVRRARARGIEAFGGEEILLAQALDQFARITGRPAPARVMARALNRALHPRAGPSGVR